MRVALGDKPDAYLVIDGYKRIAALEQTLARSNPRYPLLPAKTSAEEVLIRLFGNPAKLLASVESQVTQTVGCPSGAPRKMAAEWRP